MRTFEPNQVTDFYIPLAFHNNRRRSFLLRKDTSIRNTHPVQAIRNQVTS